MPQFVVDRLEEPTTWQAIMFFAIAPIFHFGYDAQWGVASAIGYAISAGIKAVAPDDFRVLTTVKGWLCNKF
jgi:hypothetical protein